MNDIYLEIEDVAHAIEILTGIAKVTHDSLTAYSHSPQCEYAALAIMATYTGLDEQIEKLNKIVRALAPKGGDAE